MPTGSTGSPGCVGSGSDPRSLGEIARALERLAGLDVAAVSDEELLGAVRLVERARRGLDALGCHVVGELDLRKVTDLEHGMRTKGWIARETKVPGRIAGRAVRLGGALRRLPNVDAAFREGRIGIDHVDVLARAANPRIADALDAAVPALVEGLGSMRFEGWQREVEQLAAELDQDGPEPDTRPSSVSLRQVGDELVVRGHLAALEGEGLVQTIGSITDELHRQAVRDAKEAPGDLPVPSRSELTALALIEMARRANANGRSGSAPAPELTLGIHAHASDPVQIAAPGHDGCCADGCGGSDGRAGHWWSGPIELHAPSGAIYRVNRDHVLLCDPLIAPVVLDALGVPLDAGRSQRYATREQRRALALRDGGCTFPGCDAPVAWCDAHHIWPWELGGETDLENLALLCRHHHGVTHRRGWTMTATADQWFTWTTPAGATIASQRHGRQRTGPAPPVTT